MDRPLRGLRRPVSARPSAQTTTPVRNRERQPVAGRRGRGRAAVVASMSTLVRSAPMTVTEASASAGAPDRASTTWVPRCAEPEVATAPRRTGTRATSRVGSSGCSMPISQGSPAGSATWQTMSPPADRHTSVSASASRGRTARSTAQPFTTPLGSRRRTPSGPGRHTSNAPSEAALASSPRRSTSATSGAHSPSVTSLRPRRETWLSESQVLKTWSTQRSSASASCHASSAAASAAWRPRSARLIGMPMTCSTRRATGCAVAVTAPPGRGRSAATPRSPRWCRSRR